MNKENEFDFQMLVDKGFEVVHHLTDLQQERYYKKYGYEDFQLKLVVALQNGVEDSLIWVASKRTVQLQKLSATGVVISRMNMVNELVFLETLKWYGKN